LIGPSATGPLIDNLNTVAPGPARDILTGAIEDVANSRGAAGLAFVLGLLLALYSAAGYTGAFARASNAIYKVEEGRPIWTLKPARTPRCCLVVFDLAVPMKSPLAAGHDSRRDPGGAAPPFLGGTPATRWRIALVPRSAAQPDRAIGEARSDAVGVPLCTQVRLPSLTQ
jgi:membrane protein